MPSLAPYTRALDYSYAPGIFPSMEAVRKSPELVRRLLIGSRTEGSEGVARLRALCEERGIRVETADKALARLSGKGNCFAAAVFEKRMLPPAMDAPHIVLHHPSDAGNLGTILRTALGFGFLSVAVIRPCADAFDPHVVRASMGACFSLRISEYETFEEYRAAYPGHMLYPFMLDGSVRLGEVSPAQSKPFALIFGNEGSGLPAEFAEMGQAVRIPHSDGIDSLNLSVAAAIGMYHFAQS
ncbi:MAG: TrmH family RNA methyltransferase [Clostridia bacterium]|nr:TrmH family RNA methyltransferase [Clostridia bacterium]